MSAIDIFPPHLPVDSRDCSMKASQHKSREEGCKYRLLYIFQSFSKFVSFSSMLSSILVNIANTYLFPWRSVFKGEAELKTWT